MGGNDPSLVCTVSWENISWYPKYVANDLALVSNKRMGGNMTHH
jgi:hypothetical protein